jgi:hypothetical protein
MGASKRSNYSRNSSYSNPGKDVVRNIGVVAGLGGLSFFLGFFVLAKMVPDKHGEAESTPSVTQSQLPVPTRQTVQAAVPVTSSSRETASTPASPPFHKDSAASGVTIEPDDQTAAQKPRDVDSASRSALPDTSASPSNDSANASHSTTDAAPTAPHDEVGTPTTTGSNGTTGTAHRKPRLRGHSGDGNTDLNASATDNGGISEGDQKPSRIDRDESDTSARSERHSARPDTGDAANAETPPPAKTVKRNRYRVVAGSYAQRESAERRAQRVKDLGMDADVVSITKDDGTTVYRVQQGIYRKRANAEAAQKKLTDAGMDADVVKTGTP